MSKRKKYKDWVYIVVWFVAIVALAISAIAVTVYRFKNPELTETQLVMYYMKKYWWVLTANAVPCVVYGYKKG